MERKILAYGKHYETFMKTLGDKERNKDTIVLFNCFKKKTKITPQNEIKKAIRLKNEYKKEKYGTI